MKVVTTIESRRPTGIHLAGTGRDGRTAAANGTAGGPVRPRRPEQERPLPTIRSGQTGASAGKPFLLIRAARVRNDYRRRSLRPRFPTSLQVYTCKMRRGRRGRHGGRGRSTEQESITGRVGPATRRTRSPSAIGCRAGDGWPWTPTSWSLDGDPDHYLVKRRLLPSRSPDDAGGRARTAADPNDGR